MPGLILVDIDGVIAPFAKYPQDLTGAVVEEVPGFGAVIILRDRITELVEVAEKTGAELMFHTSWNSLEANDTFPKFFGRRLESLAHSPVRAVWWKLDAVEDAMATWAESGTRVVWMDDMLDDENDFGETWGELGHRAADAAGVPMLTIIPDKYVGLTDEHMRDIRAFLS